MTDEERRAALDFEEQWRAATPEQQQQIWRSICGVQESIEPLPSLHLVMAEWFGGTVPDTPHARAERGGRSAREEIARRRHERLRVIPPSDEPEAASPSEEEAAPPAGPPPADPQGARGKPGPKPGKLARFAAADALLYPDIARLISGGEVSRSQVVRTLIAKGKVAPSNSEQTTIKRVLDGFRMWAQSQLIPN
jgi:hypothetical protein